jgi:phosphate:Na+ symporter
LVVIGLGELSAVLLQRGAPRFRRIVSEGSAKSPRCFLAGLEVSATTGTGIPSIFSLMTVADGARRDVPGTIWTLLGIDLGTIVALWVPGLLLFHGENVGVALTLLAIVLPLRLGAASRVRMASQLVTGAALLMLGIDYLSGAFPVPPILSGSGVAMTLGPIPAGLVGLAIGAGFSILARSPTATVLVAIALAVGGWLSLPAAYAMVAAANVAPAMTAYLASRSLGRRGRRVALHVALIGAVTTVLGVGGALLVVAVFGTAGSSVGGGAGSFSVALGLVLFHTAIHLGAFLVIAPAARLVGPLVDRLTPTGNSGGDGGAGRSIAFLPAGYPDSLDANLMLTQSVLAMMAEKSYEMLQIVINTSQVSDGIEESTDRVIALRGTVKELEEEVSVPLARSVQLPCSPAQAERIQQQQRIAQELSLISDDCYKTVRLLAVSYRKNFRFHQESHDELFEYTSRILDFLRYNSDYLGRRIERPDWEIANRMEETIDSLRDKLKKRARKVLEKRDDADIRGELTFIDIISHLEHVGDHCLAIAETVRGLTGSR